ncbi:hypothetical protein LCGC14_1129300 [marine sediment metagenome]|uniref:VRR-NUC domain-containing protein n=1 Tax=marine sediment metagenome TaxID=412755 RepID=A0A0F9MPF4_9ZZZZ
MIDKVAMGKKARRDGMAFERKVREDLRSEGWIVDKWTNNVEFEIKDSIISEKFNRLIPIRNIQGRLHPAKSFRGITRSNGFPDFIAFREISSCDKSYQIIVVESKMNGVLSKVEKEKCQWYLDNNIFSKILIASKGIGRNADIVYKEFERK